MLEKNQANTTVESRLLDRFLLYYIPLILLIAIGVWFLSKDINRAVAILVVSCPCGHMLIHSAPAIMMITGCMRHGVLIRDISFMEKNVNQVYFDKTGTLTTGHLSVASITPFGNHTEEEVLTLAGKLACHSTHPLSQAIAKTAMAQGDDGFHIQEHKGYGIVGEKEGVVALLGNEQWLRSHGVRIPPRENDDVLFSETYLAYQGEVMGVLFLADTMRTQAPEMVADLFAMGMKKVSMLTGDKQIIADALQKKCHLSEVFARQLPTEKQAVIASAKKQGCTAFVGDGINDTLALSSADVSIAMAAMGSDAAIQSAHISLMNENLFTITYIFRMANLANNIIYQNLLIAFSTSLCMIVLAGFGWLTVLPGALLHNIGAIIILLNSARLLHLRQKGEHC